MSASWEFCARNRFNWSIAVEVFPSSINFFIVFSLSVIVIESFVLTAKIGFIFYQIVFSPEYFVFFRKKNATFLVFGWQMCLKTLTLQRLKTNLFT